MTSLYTFVAPERQNELTRRIQQRLTAAGKSETGVQDEEMEEAPPTTPPTMPPPATPAAPGATPSLAESLPVTSVLQ